MSGRQSITNNRKFPLLTVYLTDSVLILLLCRLLSSSDSLALPWMLKLVLLCPSLGTAFMRVLFITLVGLGGPAAYSLSDPDLKPSAELCSLVIPDTAKSCLNAVELSVRIKHNT